MNFTISPRFLFHLLLFTGLLASKLGSAQHNTSRNKTGELVRIIRIEIKDTILIEYLNKFINEQLEADTLFRKKGYIQVFSIPAHKRPNVARGYYITKNYVNFDNLNDQQFPMFYSFLSGKMIIFKNSDLISALDIKYTKKSILKFQQDLEPYLFPAETIVLHDKEHVMKKAKNFRADEFFYMGGGTNVYIMNDGKKVVAVGSTYYE
jgi:hypothetical protein